MNTAFLTKLAQADYKPVTKGGTGSRKGSHNGDLYINKQGRMFGLSTKHSTHYEIENSEIDGVVTLRVRLAKPNGKDAKTGKDTYAKTAFSTSAESTGTPFVTVTKLCRELFGDDKENWARDFEKQGDADGYTYYTLIDKDEVVKSDKKEDKKDASKTDKKTK